MKRHLDLIGYLVPLAVLASLAISAAPVIPHLGGESAQLPRDLPPPAKAAPTITFDLSAVVALAPFGAKPAPDAPAPTVASAPLDLALRGIVFNGDNSLAFIATKGVTRSFRKSEKIIEGVVVTRVGEDRVVLDVSGNERILTYPNRKLAPKLAQAEAPPDPFDRLRGLVRSATPRPEDRELKPETTEDYVNLWRERIIRNPKQVLDRIGLTATENGYVINEKHNIGVKLAGLRAGDRVASVNGQPVGDMDEDRRRYDQIAASGVARLEIIRNGKTLTMSFPLR